MNKHDPKRAGFGRCTAILLGEMGDRPLLDHTGEVQIKERPMMSIYGERIQTVRFYKPTTKIAR